MVIRYGTHSSENSFEIETQLYRVQMIRYWSSSGKKFPTELLYTTLPADFMPLEEKIPYVLDLVPFVGVPPPPSIITNTQPTHIHTIAITHTYTQSQTHHTHTHIHTHTHEDTHTYTHTHSFTIIPYRDL